MKLEELERIFNTTEPDEHGCQNWSGSRQNWSERSLSERGYGKVYIDGIGHRRVHRLALERKLGRPINELVPVVCTKIPRR
jgi:hypothetical protein